jgi:heat shock protein HspQ
MEEQKDFKFELGDMVKDKLTGWVGIVNARAEYRLSTPNYGLVPRTLPGNGTVPKMEWFEETRLEKGN